MSERKGAYEFTPKGRIKKYDINYDIGRFSFMPKDCSILEKMVLNLNGMLNDFVGTKPYVIDWEDIIKEYLEIGIGDVPHFASQYVFGIFIVEKRTDEKLNMEAMYLEIVDGLNEEIEKGHLPGTVD